MTVQPLAPTDVNTALVLIGIYERSLLDDQGEYYVRLLNWGATVLSRNGWTQDDLDDLTKIRGTFKAKWRGIRRQLPDKAILELAELLGKLANPDLEADRHANP